MAYHQITEGERYQIAALRQAGYCAAAIARRLGRHRSTIGREVERNRSHHDGGYRPNRAQELTNGRRSRSRRNTRFTELDWVLVESEIRDDLSPEQASGILRKRGQVSISHETIYRHVWADRFAGGNLHRHLRCSGKKRRKRYGARDRRGHLAGKRGIEERPPAVEKRRSVGHWEIDTVVGPVGSGHCIVTLVERATGYVLIGKLRSREKAELNRRTVELMARYPGQFKTITADNGSEFHGYKVIEQKTGVRFFFARPHHSWERGSNENMNGLIRQYLPKRKSMEGVTQLRCDQIAWKLNMRPRKRYNYDSPDERFQHRLASCVALQS